MIYIYKVQNKIKNTFIIVLFLVGELTPTGNRRKLGLPPFITPVTNRIEPETENKLKLIMKRNGIITIENISYQTEIKDLDDLGELGNGTSGHVVKMMHKQTSKVIAVKVTYFFFFILTINQKIKRLLCTLYYCSKCVALEIMKKTKELLWILMLY